MVAKAEYKAHPQILQSIVLPTVLYLKYPLTQIKTINFKLLIKTIKLGLYERVRFLK